MNKKELIKQSIKSLEKLPESILCAVADFIDFISEKYREERHIQNGIEKMINQSDSFSFLNDEEDIYGESDLIEKYK